MAETVNTNQFKNGMHIELDGNVWRIVEFQHVKPGKGSAFVRTRIRNLLTGRVLEPTLKSGEKVGKPDMEEKEMQYLYKEGEHYVFMDVKTYEQTHIGGDALKEAKNFLKENMNAHILSWNGRAISADLPNTVELKVTRCDPGVRGQAFGTDLRDDRAEMFFYFRQFVRQGSE